MSDDLSKKTVLVADSGQFTEVAIRLKREFGRVIFWNPELVESFPMVAKNAIGNGFEEIEWVRDFWPIKDEIDLYVFGDCSQAGLQLEIESQGARVIGSRNGDRLENSRIAFKKVQKRIGLEVPKHVVVTGLEDLRSHLKTVKDRWVKFDRYRGTFETEHHVNYELSQNWLNKLAYELGPMGDIIEFLIEEPIRGKVEIGYDGLFFGGFPSKTLFGIERKSKSYIGAVKDYIDLNPRLLEVNAALATELKKHDYHNFLSTEVRIAEDDENFADGTPVLIEPTCRWPSPPFEAMLEIYSNLGAMLWHGSVGEIIEPEMAEKFAVICRISHDDPPEGWRTLQVPDAVRQWVKLYDAVKKDGCYHIAPKVPHANRIGAVVGIGSTIEKAAVHCHENMEALDEQPISSEYDSLTDALVALKAAEDQGIEIAPTIPEPAIVLEQS
jgi:hypothetical protein